MILHEPWWGTNNGHEPHNAYTHTQFKPHMRRRTHLDERGGVRLDELLLHNGAELGLRRRVEVVGDALLFLNQPRLRLFWGDSSGGGDGGCMRLGVCVCVSILVCHHHHIGTCK